MITDIEACKIGCVTTKDLSGLGRNYIEADSYIEIFLLKYNVRYIAITDGVDSLNRQKMDITPFKNILNDMYRRDIFKKVLSGITIRSRQGKFCGGTLQLGLMRDPEDKGHLSIDSKTAPIIRKIYDYALAGLHENFQKADGRKNPRHPCEVQHIASRKLLLLGWFPNQSYLEKSLL